MPHHFTLLYFPGTNGAVARLEKKPLRILRAILSALQMIPNKWPYLDLIVQSALNTSPSPQRDNVAPVTAFMKQSASSPANGFVCTATSSPGSMGMVNEERKEAIVRHREVMKELHPIVPESRETNREHIRNAIARESLPNFMEADFFLITRDDALHCENLSKRCRGPRKIKKALSDYMYQVKDLRNGELITVHGARLEFHRYASLN